MEQKQNFFVQYFRNILSPQAIFSNRKSLSWPKMLLIFVILLLLSLIPITIKLTKPTNFSLSLLTPNAYQLIKENEASFSKIKIKNGKLQEKTPQVFVKDKKGGLLATNQKDQAITKADHAIVFQQKSWFLKETREGQPAIFETAYGKDFNSQALHHAKDWQDKLTNNWYQKNRQALIVSNSVSLFGFLLVNNLLLLVFAAVILWFARRKVTGSIGTVKEGFNLSLNAFGIGGLVAAVVACFSLDLTMIVGIQAIGMLLMLVLSFAKTKFKDPV